MSNIYVQNQQDPLLFGGRTANSYANDYIPYFGNMQNQRMAETQSQKDYLGDLDSFTKGLDAATIESLSENQEYSDLSKSLQATIQDELMTLIRQRINTNPSAIENIRKQMQIIRDVQNATKEEERKSLMELNDYMKNYSHLTFDEYRRIMNGNGTDFNEIDSESDTKRNKRK